MDEIKDDSTRATSHLRASCIGFSTPISNNIVDSNNLLSTGGKITSRVYQVKVPKFNLEQDSLVKKTEETYKYISDEESHEKTDGYLSNSDFNQS